MGIDRKFGLVLVNLSEEPEYCEKLMYVRDGMTTPAHCHGKKKEDIVSRWGRLGVRVWTGSPEKSRGKMLSVPVNHEPRPVRSGDVIELDAGSRATLVPGVYHELFPLSEECIIGEISTGNDDWSDNFFVDSNVKRFPAIEEDEPAIVRLISDE